MVPLLGNLYLVCTLLCTIWMIGDFNTADIVSGGAPNGSTDVLATLGVDYLFDDGKPALGVAAVDLGPAAADPGRDAAGAPACSEARCSCERRLLPLRQPAGAPAALPAAAVADRGGLASRSACVLLIWWLLPLYNMLLIALDPDGRPEFSGNIWPAAPSSSPFEAVLFKGYWYLKDFWHQLGNSFFIGVMTMVLTVAISSLASFALGRMRLSQGWAVIRRPRCSSTRSRRISW